MFPAPVFGFVSGLTTKSSPSSAVVCGSSVNTMTSASVFGPAAGSTQAHSNNVSAFGMSSFGSNVTTATTESIQPIQPTHSGVFNQGVAVPSFGFGASTSAVFSFQPTQSVFGQSAATCSQPATLQPNTFSFAAASNNPFVFGAQQSAPSTTAVFSLGKRTNVDGIGGDGNKRQATGFCSIFCFEFLF